jgi:hypothetical protein
MSHIKGDSMDSHIDLKQINSKVQLMKKTAKELRHLGADFPALARNLVRIEASLKMLEINISDLFEFEL